MRGAAGKIFLAFLAATVFAASSPSRALPGSYRVAVMNAPVLNEPDFRAVFGGDDGKTLSLDSSGLMRALEFIAFPGTVFKVLEETEYPGILRVSTADYPCGGSRLYVDGRFTESRDFHPGERVKRPPPEEEIKSRLRKMRGVEYLWGGNTPRGVPEMMDFYKPAGEPGRAAERVWGLQGVDCSGLIYLASEGFTPRNTSSLVHFGEMVEIEGLCAGGIARIAEPLDLIVWAGHVIIVLDRDTAVESTRAAGVHESDLRLRLNEVLKSRTPENEWSGSGRRFVLRRWPRP